ncbi:agamous-like MADS-box protein AGL12 isoform X2 [Olea europaea var. sylvestris]|uniref:agamous-like MADS-box protein AGL12 isoform X2 n=1 Tax=Olea europaea var. sylvestris TaxID=158386 RepID=UPI000C1CCDF5|nr:agamous-like MADS-box protein AGL12 isoform X2 [Olea europaea var. sylvestris]
MARGKIQMKRIENPVHRQVTFCKRRAGLLKKAKELSVLCDAEIGVIIFSAHGKIFEQASKGAMQGLIERYMKNNRGTQAEQVVKDKEVVDLKDEISKLKLEIDVLQKGIRFIFGGGNDSMTLDEMNVLEKHLELWMCHVRSAKPSYFYPDGYYVSRNPVAEEQGGNTEGS